MVYDVVFNTNSLNLVFWVSIVVDIQTVSIAIASVSVVAGVIYYALQLRHQTRIRETDLITRLYSMANTHEFLDASKKVGSLQVKDYEDYVKQYGPFLSESPMHEALVTICIYFDFIGLLLYRKHVDIDLAYDVIGGMIKYMYGKLKPILVGLRKDLGEPLAYAGFDYLYNEVMRKEPQLRKTVMEALFPPLTSANSPDKSSRC
jgi:hypothetical protein